MINAYAIITTFTDIDLWTIVFAQFLKNIIGTVPLILGMRWRINVIILLLGLILTSFAQKIKIALQIKKDELRIYDF